MAHCEGWLLPAFFFCATATKNPKFTNHRKSIEQFKTINNKKSKDET
jgi:hypothetical protein